MLKSEAQNIADQLALVLKEFQVSSIEVLPVEGEEASVNAGPIRAIVLDQLYPAVSAVLASLGTPNKPFDIPASDHALSITITDSVVKAFDVAPVNFGEITSSIFNPDYVTFGPDFVPAEGEEFIEDLRVFVKDAIIRFKSGSSSRVFFGGFDDLEEAGGAAAWVLLNLWNIFNVTIFDISRDPTIDGVYWSGRFWVLVMV
jgi:hypothetical protein